MNISEERKKYIVVVVLKKPNKSSSVCIKCDDWGEEMGNSSS